MSRQHLEDPRAECRMKLMSCFERMCEWMESEAELYTVPELWGSQNQTDAYCLTLEEVFPAALSRLHRHFIDLKCQLSTTSRTARLWIHYLNYINIIKDFIYAGRTANWSLHLSAVSRMLNLLPPQATSIIQTVTDYTCRHCWNCPVGHPWLYNMFCDG